jgi:hypothetical protein
MADQTSSQDKLRSERQFVSLFNGLFGFEDQSMANTDGYTASPPGGYQVIDPNTGAVGAQGLPVSTGQTVGGMSPIVLVGLVLAIGVGAWLVTRKG